MIPLKTRILLADGRGRYHVHPRGPLLRGGGRTPRQRCPQGLFELGSQAHRPDQRQPTQSRPHELHVSLGHECGQAPISVRGARTDTETHDARRALGPDLSTGLKRSGNCAPTSLATGGPEGLRPPGRFDGRPANDRITAPRCSPGPLALVGFARRNDARRAPASAQPAVPTTAFGRCSPRVAPILSSRDRVRRVDVATGRGLREALVPGLVSRTLEPLPELD